MGHYLSEMDEDEDYRQERLRVQRWQEEQREKAEKLVGALRSLIKAPRPNRGWDGNALTQAQNRLDELEMWIAKTYGVHV